MRNGKSRRVGGFTLIELLVVLAIIGTLLTIVTPRYFQQTERAREVVLLYNLRGLREALDQYWQDRGAGPEVLDDLVAHHYLREMPLDPVLGRHDGWVAELDEQGGIRNVHSGAQGEGLNGAAYATW